MFTGLIEALGQVHSVENRGGVTALTVTADLFSQEAIEIGDSICTSGVCLTVVQHHDAAVTFELASETLRVTSLGTLKVADTVNLETSLRVGDKLGGHFVFGHVDGVGRVLDSIPEGETTVFSFSYPEALRGLIVKKGSIAIDGVSLTVGEVTSESFSVYIIPHTLQQTTFARLQVGAQVNLEIDMLARYVKGVYEAYR